MPANLTPQYLSAEQRFKEAVTTQQKVEAIEEMMAVIPKHKGTEKLQADLRRRLAKLRSEAAKKPGISKASARFTVPREGAGQVILLGAPNVGKSSLLARLTHAAPEIGVYPYTTRLPQPGMMPFENIRIQLVDMPAIDRHAYEPWMGGVARQADFVLLVVDLGSDDLLDEADGVLGIMAESKIELEGRALILANKLDAAHARDNLQILREFYDRRFEVRPVSAATGEGLADFGAFLFERLGVIRVYTKAPGKKVDLASPPYVLKHGGTVLDAARAVHRDFVHALKFARVWSSERSKRPVRFEGQMVERGHELEDGDILELHT